MAKRAGQQRPLRELINDCVRLTREVTEHVDRGFIPKTRRVRHLVSPEPPDPEYEAVEDITVRHGAGELLESEKFTSQVFSQIEDYCEAIDRAVAEIVSPRTQA